MPAFDETEIELDLLAIAEAPGPEVHEGPPAVAAVDASALRGDLGDEATAPILIIAP